MIRIRDIIKFLDLLTEARDEFGNIYGDRLKKHIPIYRKLDVTIKEINKERKRWKYSQ